MAPLTPLQREADPPQNALGAAFLNQTKSPATSVSTAATSSTIENHHLSPTAGTASMNMQQQQQQHLSPADSLHLMRQGPEQTISKLRASLQDSTHRDATAKAALAKSDAVILELRSSIRQLKRQVEHVQKEKDVSLDGMAQLQRQLSSLEHSTAYSIKEEQQLHDQQVHQLQSQLQLSETQAKEQVVGELQVQLDRAHAQILTADMVRKELEDTLEAEQYTWELRVQDQERQIVLLQEECQTCRDDLNECRAQWREAEEGWNDEIQALKTENLNSRSVNHNSHGDMNGKLQVLEKEREELQGCLDEAMKELEAVDQELRQNPNVLEPLQHLYRWLLERHNLPDRKIPTDANQLVSRIEDLMEQEASNDNTNDGAVKVAELEAQLSVYRGDLKAREESSAELRASLKEAVALLKPLQDAVGKTDHEKKELEQELDSLRQERDQLEQKIKSPIISPTSLASTQRSMPSGEEQQEMSGARGKRNKAQESLAKMLNSAQSRFQELHHDNSAVVEENELLAKRVEELEREMIDVKSVGDEESIKRDVASEMREAAIQQLEEDVKGYSQELARKERKLEELEEAVQQAQDTSSSSVAASDYEALKSQAEDLELEVSQKRDIEQQLASVRRDLRLKAEAERMLNESLKEALGLLQPLQMHLETAEKEKKVVTKKLKSVKKKLFRLENGQEARSPGRSVRSTSDMPDDQASDLEVIIQELEQENAHLRPRQSKLQEDLVEVQSRYAVTHDKLESAAVENHALVDALKSHEHQESEMMEELDVLRKKLEKSEHELENAKYIATSALMKVEELTMADVSNSLSRDIVDHKQQAVQQSPGEVLRLKQQLASLHEEVDYARELNDSLEESIQERDRMLNALSDQQSLSPGLRKGGGQRVKWDNH
eukprot:CAMPEP_0119024336 /NCGR_PEP_ID=MMETSP1176-20130426/31680_1 /TAXON_ID=265551 /ORGANISM="Synedropsis recta cf, Strain CCMP1620" /LENGTH=892 /DNA_ID=CAMNT_0006979603 /DNA_START=48 /DNA_END=2726 /DNA_ORIENTATION=-